MTHLANVLAGFYGMKGQGEKKDHSGAKKHLIGVLRSNKLTVADIPEAMIEAKAIISHRSAAFASGQTTSPLGD